MKRLVLAASVAALVGCATRKADDLAALGPQPLAEVQLDAAPNRADTAPRPGLERPAPIEGEGIAPLPPRFKLEALLVPLANASVSQLRDVTVEVAVEGVNGPVELAVEFQAPGEVVFDRQVRTLEGTAFEVHQEAFVLPVAGTAIDQGSLSGDWQARVFLGGAPKSSLSFGLTP